MDGYDRKISEILLAIEAELRFLSLWRSEPPDDEDLLSERPFCYDTLDLPQWMQWVLLPRMWRILEQGGPYPAHCGIYPYAQEWAIYQGVNSLSLLNLIRRFDALIEDRSASGQH